MEAVARKRAPRKKKIELAEETPPLALPVSIRSNRGHRVKRFIEKYLPVPDGMLFGQMMELLPEQIEFIDDVYNNTGSDGSLITRRGILSISRKNGKSGLISALVGAHLIGPEAKPNSHLYSAARSRDQAALVFNYLAKSLRLRNDLEGMVQITDSSKKIKGLLMGTEYRALSADATTAHGLSPALTIHDELGQVIGPSDPLYDALETAGGAQTEPLSLIISTQAASDTDLLSTLIDDALFNPTPQTVCKLYAAAKEDDIFDEDIWYKVNFALGKFRSIKEFREAAERAQRLPAFEQTFRNLYLNQRISLIALLLSPTVWKENAQSSYEEDLFTSGLPVHLGLDLSQNKDLTAAVATVQDPETKRLMVKCWTFTPIVGLKERAKTDKVPYEQWVKEGWLIALPGRIVNYDMVCQYLKEKTEGMNIVGCHFDRWRIEFFRKAAADNDFLSDLPADGWKPVGQGFRDMSPRIDSFETFTMDGAVATNNNPVLNMAASNAVVAFDPAKNRKLEKAKSSARIDPLVALVMSAYGFSELAELEEKKPEVTENSLFFV